MRANQQDLGSAKRWGGLAVVSARTFAARCEGGCDRPHWGYVIHGVLRVAYPDHEEVIFAGDAYYVAPHHLSFEFGDAELVDFSPSSRRFPASTPHPEDLETWPRD
jgi:hypothetical protein